MKNQKFSSAIRSSFCSAMRSCLRVILVAAAAYAFVASSVTCLQAQPYKGKQTYSWYTMPNGEVTPGCDWERIQQNPQLVYSDYLPYPVTDDNPSSIPSLTPAPEGYKPFYISHYGRHGSRWLISTRYYTAPVAMLKKAKEAGQLTELGLSLLERFTISNEAAISRYGELTPLGHKQHSEIAGRMFKNFPEVFEGEAEVDARSTVIIRCILSMDSFCQRLKELNPNLNIINDASYFDMSYMNYQDPDGFFRAARSDKDSEKALADYSDNVMKPERFVASILKDPKWLDEYNLNKDSSKIFLKLSAQQFFYYTAQQVINLPNTPLTIKLDDLLTLEELYQVYLSRNAESYFYAGWDNLSHNVMPYRQTNLLRNILETAKQHIAENKGGATLRFGHDSNLLPLCSLMDIDGAGVHVDSIEEISDNWAMYWYIPKAGNLQFVFYRSEDEGAPVLVKVLLNEHEAVLPIATDMFPYYKWDDFLAFYENLLKDSPANNLSPR